MTGRAQDVRRASVRVALGTTAAVAAVYLAIAVAVLAIVTTNLTQQVDNRLRSALTSMTQPQGGGGGDDGQGQPPEGPHDRPLGPPLLIWLVSSNGTVATQVAANLPSYDYAVTSPKTTTINGTTVRIAGVAVPGGHLVVGQDLTDVNSTESTLILAELIIGPILLVIVFLGAVFIGRRVATPIEIARRRQLDFSADASHELRTPLSVIEAQTSLALAEHRNADWYREAFGRVSGESRRMRSLLDDLLWLSRFDASQGHPEGEPVDLGVLAAQTVDRFRPIAEARGQTLSLEATDGQIVNAPPDWLDRLLGVLLDNACKYSPETGAIRVAVGSDANRVTLTVDDSGPGIPEEERGRIFDRFHRATEAGGGAGLGLAIADEIVRATGGRWRLDVAPTGGARMQVSWPKGRLGA
jgi:two-component system sensor histidine kinase CiaH